VPQRGGRLLKDPLPTNPLSGKIPVFRRFVLRRSYAGRSSSAIPSVSRFVQANVRLRRPDSRPTERPALPRPLRIVTQPPTPTVLRRFHFGSFFCLRIRFSSPPVRLVRLSALIGKSPHQRQVFVEISGPIYQIRIQLANPILCMSKRLESASGSSFNQFCIQLVRKASSSLRSHRSDVLPERVTIR